LQLAGELRTKERALDRQIISTLENTPFIKQAAGDTPKALCLFTDRRSRSARRRAARRAIAGIRLLTAARRPAGSRIGIAARRVSTLRVLIIFWIWHCFYSPLLNSQALGN